MLLQPQMSMDQCKFSLMAQVFPACQGRADTGGWEDEQGPGNKTHRLTARKSFVNAQLFLIAPDLISLPVSAALLTPYEMGQVCIIMKSFSIEYLGQAHTLL